MVVRCVDVLSLWGTGSAAKEVETAIKNNGEGER